MALLPCKNPNCKSHGRPHPNCKCYGYAEGGIVDAHYCDSPRHHKPWCEHYQKLSDGGTAQKLPSFDDMPNEAPTEKLPSFDEMPNEAPASTMSFDEMPDESEKKKYEKKPTPFIPESMHEFGERAKATAEGLMHGFIPFGDQLESGLGIANREDIERRKQEYPDAYGAGNFEGTVGSFVSGPMKLLGKAATGAAKLAGMSEKGAKVFSGISQIVGQNTSDELSKYLLGQSPESAGDMVGHLATNIGVQSALFLGLPVAGRLLQKIGGDVGNRALKELLDVAKKKELLPDAKDASKAAAAVATGYFGAKGRIANAAEAWLIRPYIERILDKPLTKANKYASDIVLKALSSNNPEAATIVHELGSKLTNATNNIYNAVESAFTGAMTKAVPAATEKQREAMKEMLDTNEYQAKDLSPYEPKFAKGGEVGLEQQQDHFATLYPEASLQMQLAKGRVKNYLNSIKPSKLGGGLLFDDPAPQKQKQRSFNNAIEIAINPLSVMNKVAKGNLNTEDMKHLSSMWPEVHRTLSKKMTEKLLQSKLKGEKPNYKNRQAMSLFLGAPLDTTFTPGAIQTIQATFASRQQAAHQQSQAKPQKSTSSLTKTASAYMTEDQARDRRQQMQKS